MKITVEMNPEDLSSVTEQVMRAAGPEAVGKIWMSIGSQIAGQIQAQMMSQVPDAFRSFFNLQSNNHSNDSPGNDLNGSGQKS